MNCYTASQVCRHCDMLRLDAQTDLRHYLSLSSPPPPHTHSHARIYEHSHTLAHTYTHARTRTQTHTHTHTHTHTQGDRDRQKDRDREAEAARERERDRVRQRGTETERDKERGRRVGEIRRKVVGGWGGVVLGVRLRASLSSTFLQTLPESAVPLNAGELCISTQLSTDAVSALRKVWILVG